MPGTPNAPTAITAHPEGCVVALTVVPRSGRTVIERGEDGAIRVRLAAPPVDGAANDALVRVLADRFRIPRRSVRIVSGAGSRRKRVVLAGVSPDLAAQRLC